MLCISIRISVGVKNRLLNFVEVVVIVVSVKLFNRVYVIPIVVLPVTNIVILFIKRLCGDHRNIGQRVAQIHIDLVSLEKRIIYIIEVYGKYVLNVAYCIVGEVACGKGQRILILNLIKHGFNRRSNVINCCMVSAKLFLERNCHGCRATVERGAYQIKTVNEVVIIVGSNLGGPTVFLTKQRGYCQRNLFIGSICENIAQSFVIQRNGHIVCAGSAITCDHSSQSNSVVYFSKLQENGDGSGSSQTLANFLIAAKHDVITASTVGGNVSVTVVVCGLGELRIVLSVRGSSRNATAGCSVAPACKCVTVLIVKSLGRRGYCGSCAVINYHLLVQNTLNVELDGCSVLSNVSCVTGYCGESHAVTLPALEIKVCQGCVIRRNLAVCIFLGNKIAKDIKDDGVGSFGLCIYSGIGCITQCHGQSAFVNVAVRIHPTLKGVMCGIGAALYGSITHISGNGAVREEVAVQNSTVLVHKGNGILMCYVLCIRNGILTGHGGQLVAFFVHPHEIVAVLGEIGAVKHDLCVVRQEALEQHFAVLIDVSDGIQVCYVNIQRKIGSDIARGNVIAKHDGSAVNGDIDLIKHSLEPCTGIVGHADSIAEFALAVVLVGQLCIIELIGNSVEYQVDQTICILISSLCLCGIGNAILEFAKCLDHALNDILCACGAYVKLVGNTGNSLL